MESFVASYISSAAVEHCNDTGKRVVVFDEVSKLVFNKIYCFFRLTAVQQKHLTFVFSCTVPTNVNDKQMRNFFTCKLSRKLQDLLVCFCHFFECWTFVDESVFVLHADHISDFQNGSRVSDGSW